MIRSFKSKETEKIFSRQRSSLLPDDIQRLALRELRLLDQAVTAREGWVSMNHNGGDVRGGTARYSIPVDDRWRISFEWRDGHAYEVDVVDAKAVPA
jgi:proteic killer suppression protein